MGRAEAMEVRIENPGRLIDCIRLEACLREADPAALIDVESASGALRVSTLMTTQELLQAVHAGGLSLGPETLVHLPSVCCGGCGG